MAPRVFWAEENRLSTLPDLCKKILIECISHVFNVLVTICCTSFLIKKLHKATNI